MSCLVNIHQQYLTEYPTHYPTVALIYLCTRPEPFDIKTASHEQNRTHIDLQHQVGKLIYFLMQHKQSNQH